MERERFSEVGGWIVISSESLDWNTHTGESVCTTWEFLAIIVDSEELYMSRLSLSSSFRRKKAPLIMDWTCGVIYFKLFFGEDHFTLQQSPALIFSWNRRTAVNCSSSRLQHHLQTALLQPFVVNSWIFHCFKYIPKPCSHVHSMSIIALGKSISLSFNQHLTVWSWTKIHLPRSTWCSVTWSSMVRSDWRFRNR